MWSRKTCVQWTSLGSSNRPRPMCWPAEGRLPGRGRAGVVTRSPGKPLPQGCSLQERHGGERGRFGIWTAQHKPPCPFLLRVNCLLPGFTQVNCCPDSISKGPKWWWKVTLKPSQRFSLWEAGGFCLVSFSLCQLLLSVILKLPSAPCASPGTCPLDTCLSQEFCHESQKRNFSVSSGSGIVVGHENTKQIQLLPCWSLSLMGVLSRLESYPTLCSPMDCSPLGYSVHAVSQAGVPEWGTTSHPRGIFPSQGSPTSAGRCLYY